MGQGYVLVLSRVTTGGLFIYCEEGKVQAKGWGGLEAATLFHFVNHGRSLF